MADVVLGVAASHAPQGATPPELWERIGEMDRYQRPLYDSDGRLWTYEELLDRADRAILSQLSLEVRQKRYAACQQAIERLADVIEAVSPDAVLIIGDDQDEIFHPQLMPAITIYWGETVAKRPAHDMIDSIGVREAAWSFGRDERVYPVAASLARQLIERLVAQGFDIAQLHGLPDGQGIGHAFSFVNTRLLRERPVPIIPLMLNTYFPPNQPSPNRCYELSRAIAEAARDMPQGTRLAVVASGGMSHFVIDETLDRRLLRALAEGDAQALREFPSAALQSGTSELRNWIAIAGAVEHLSMNLIDYIPCYRTPAGTGCALGFAFWR